MRWVVTIAKVLAYAVVGLILVGAVFAWSMRFADGPLGPVAGGAFTSGNTYQGPEPDWSFLRDRQEVEFQLLNPPRSRTTWILEHEGRIYIPCGYMNETWGRLWKQWPIEAEQDGRALLRVDGVVYPRRLVRISEGPQLPFLLSELFRKYFSGGTTPSDESNPQTLDEGLEQIRSGSLWIFELVPPGDGTT